MSVYESIHEYYRIMNEYIKLIRTDYILCKPCRRLILMEAEYMHKTVIRLVLIVQA